MTFFGNYDDVRVAEAEVPAAGTKSGQRIRVGVVERDNGLVMAKVDAIRSSLYDLGDQNSTTHTVLLPHGTVIKLAAATAPSVGSYRARFEVSNPKLGKTVEAKGASDASEVANQIDLLALAKVDKDALAKVTELWKAGDADELMIELGLREAPLVEADVHVSGYTTKSGKHVGAYSQIRATLSKLEHGQTAHFPEGFKVKKEGSRFELFSPGSSKPGAITSETEEATREIAQRSAASTHAKSLGGATSSKHVNTSAKIDNLDADNPNARDKKRFSEDQLIQNFKTMHGREPNDKERKAAGLKPKGRSSTTLDRGPGKGGEPIPGAKPFTGSRRSKQNLHGLADVGKPGKPHSRTTADRGGSKNTTPSGLPLPSGVTRHSRSGGPGQVDDPTRADHRSKQSDASFGDVSTKTIEGWSDRVLEREFDAEPGRTPEGRAFRDKIRAEIQRRKASEALALSFISR